MKQSAGARRINPLIIRRSLAGAAAPVPVAAEVCSIIGGAGGRSGCDDDEG